MEQFDFAKHFGTFFGRDMTLGCRQR